MVYFTSFIKSKEVGLSKCLTILEAFKAYLSGRVLVEDWSYSERLAVWYSLNIQCAVEWTLN